MATWEIPLASPLEASTIWTAITQQRIPCSTHKYVIQVRTSKHLKVGKWSKRGRWKRTWGWYKLGTAHQHSWGSSPHSCRSCGWAEKPGQGHRAWECGRPRLSAVHTLSGGWHFRWRSKAMQAGCLPLASQTIPPFAFGVRLWSTVSASPRISTIELHFSPSEGVSLWLTGPGVRE